MRSFAVMFGMKKNEEAMTHAHPVEAPDPSYECEFSRRDGVLVIAGVQLVVARRLIRHRETQERGKTVERVEAAIEAKNKLVQVRLHVLVAHGVVRTEQPRLEIGKDEVDQREMLLGHRRVTALRDLRVVDAAFFRESIVAAPVIRGDARVTRDRLTRKVEQRAVRAIRDDAQTPPARILASAPEHRLRRRLAR